VRASVASGAIVGCSVVFCMRATLRASPLSERGAR
jgi:hypothetical protein